VSLNFSAKRIMWIKRVIKNYLVKKIEQMVKALFIFGLCVYLFQEFLVGLVAMDYQSNLYYGVLTQRNIEVAVPFASENECNDFAQKNQAKCFSGVEMKSR